MKVFFPDGTQIRENLSTLGTGAYVLVDFHLYLHTQGVSIQGIDFKNMI
jgi:hypothetical protein